MKTRAEKRSSGVRTPKRRKAPPRKTNAVLDLVRAGVERFILQDAPIGSFQKAIRAAARKGETSSHPLTAAVFRRIVRQAIRERTRRLDRATREQSESIEEREI